MTAVIFPFVKNAINENSRSKLAAKTLRYSHVYPKMGRRVYQRYRLQDLHSPVDEIKTPECSFLNRLNFETG